MQYKSLYEQNEEMITILKMNNDLMDVLNYIEDYVAYLKEVNPVVLSGRIFGEEEREIFNCSYAERMYFNIIPGSYYNINENM